MYATRDLVLIKFPFTDLSNFKKRPAIIIYKHANFNDVVVIPVTSTGGHINSNKLIANDLESGVLNKDSNVLYMKLFTISETQIIKKIGVVKRDKMNIIVNNIKINL